MRFTIDVTPGKLLAATLVTALLAAGLASVITWLVLRGDGSRVVTEAPVTEAEPAAPADGDRAAADGEEASAASPSVAPDGEKDPAPVDEQAGVEVAPPPVEPDEGPEKTETGPGATEEQPPASVEDEAAAEEPTAVVEPEDEPQDTDDDPGPTEEEPPASVEDEAAKRPSEPDEELQAASDPAEETGTGGAAEEADDAAASSAAPDEATEAVAAPAGSDDAAGPSDEAAAMGAAGQAADAAPASAEPDVDSTASTASVTFARDAGPRGEDTLIAANGDTTCAVILDGGITCWGADSLQHRLTAAGVHDVVAVSLSDRKFGNNSTVVCVLHGNGTVSCWGDGHDGRLGHGDDNSSVLARQVPGLEDVTAIAAGGGHTCALHAGGGVSCWGDGDWGQMGDGTDATRRSPFRVPGVEDVVAIAAGYARTCGVHSDGTVTCWGRWGAAGYSAVPAKMSGFRDVVSLAAGVYHLCAVHADGSVSCSFYGSGFGDTTPSAVRGIDDAVAVSAGEGTVCALHRQGEVSCWGRNHEGQVGDGTRVDAPRPVRLGGIDDAVAVTVSGPNRREEVHACALREGGGAYCWGNNAYQQLGTGDREDRLVPTQVAAIEEGRLDVDPLPITPVGFLETFTELVVAEEEAEFPWLRTTWEALRGKVDFTEMGSFGGYSQHYCQMRGNAFVCEPLAVRFSTRFGVDQNIIAHEFAHAYDANTAATPTRAWGAVQLYFNVTYKECFPGIESIGAEFLADTMSHLIEPSAWLTYYESTDIPENDCARNTPEPTQQDEEVVLAGLAGVVPAWYTENITNGAELWAAFRSRPGDKLLANIMHEFGGLCRTDWIRYPLEPSLFPADGTNPFRDGGC